MWGGLTTPDELRAIADVADKFKIPTVKVTGGQRIDLLGVRKEDLPAVWAQLNAAGLVSGQAYAKGLRTVKTCVGSEWCRFGTQDSTGLGVKLERYLCGSWTPAQGQACRLRLSAQLRRSDGEGHRHHLRRVRLRHPYRRRCRTACPRHRLARATSRPKTRRSSTVAAVLQLYREQAGYLERVWKWAREDRARENPRGDHRRPRRPPRARAAVRDVAARRAQGSVGRTRRGPRTARVHAARLA